MNPTSATTYALLLLTSLLLAALPALVALPAEPATTVRKVPVIIFNRTVAFFRALFQTALSDFYVEYRLVCQPVPSEPRPRAEVLATLHQHLLDVFNESGVQIMSPHYFSDPAEPKLVPRSRHRPQPAPHTRRADDQS